MVTKSGNGNKGFDRETPVLDSRSVTVLNFAWSCSWSVTSLSLWTYWLT